MQQSVLLAVPHFVLWTCCLATVAAQENEQITAADQRWGLMVQFLASYMSKFSPGKLWKSQIQSCTKYIAFSVLQLHKSNGQWFASRCCSSAAAVQAPLEADVFLLSTIQVYFPTMPRGKDIINCSTERNSTSDKAIKGCEINLNNLVFGVPQCERLFTRVKTLGNLPSKFTPRLDQAILK